MDDVQIDALPAVASASMADVVPAMAGGATSKLTIAQILAGFHVAAAKAVLVDNDEFALSDSAASWTIKRLSFANLKNSLLTVPLVPSGGNAPVDPDMDTFMTAGWSGRVQFSTTAIAHAPPEAGIFYAFVLYTNGTRLTQILIPYSNIASAHMWIRNISSTSWNAWRRFAFLDEVLPLIGGTLTGKLTLDGDPLNNLHAASKQYVDKHQGAAKAWVNFDGTGTVTIRDSYNVSSITDDGTGIYKINFATAMVNANYAVVGTCQRPDTNDGFTVGIRYNVTPTTAMVGISTAAANVYGDATRVCVAVFGD